MHIYPFSQEPTAEDLAAVEEEMPLIMAEVKLLDAEIRLMVTGGDEITRHQVRQAERVVIREARAYYGRHRAAIQLAGRAA
ncbi:MULTISPECIES: DUF6284 family protein [Catenuloplanes]|uniref:Uncharacterized protein n=1 Tax=Catenuloplanes niger TaxID=587534 RepID=A0AAE4CTI5_9ACTN|nr:DUF6284 family protein [Catenuloplanes niger]MDR7324160.1 hypothetical protein [Catenuloplanes niger]